MSEDWTAVAAEVAEALGDFQEVTLHQPGSGGTYDPATDTTSGASEPQDHIGSGIEEFYSARDVDGSRVMEGDIRLMLSPLKADGSAMPLPVAESWTLSKADGEWLIKQVDRYAPAGVLLYYVLRLRRAGS